MSELVHYWPGFLAAYSILIVAASSPGPAVAMLLGISVSNGRGAALITSAGIATGSIVINLATMFGVGLLLSQAAWAMSILKLLGAAYLAWLAFGAFRRAASPPAVQAANGAHLRGWRAFVAGILLQVTNVKAIAFWLAIAAIGATKGGGPVIIFAFAAGAFLISFACHAAWALLLSSTPFRRAYSNARRGIEAALGGILGYFAFRMAMDRS